MKLYYYQQINHKLNGVIPNFGDDLNPWLWTNLIPEIFSDDGDSYFLGAGTLINDNLLSRLPKAKDIIIFGTGVGYGKSIPSLDERWKIYALRGPLSAKALEVDPNLGLIDSGILIRRLFTNNFPKRWHAAYMPHVSFASQAGCSWQSICENLDILFIDPRWPLDKVMQAICETELLITEAMHGAIAAEALRTPWIPVKTSPGILSFKWQDWCQSIGIEYEPVNIELDVLKWVKKTPLKHISKFTSTQKYTLSDTNQKHGSLFTTSEYYLAKIKAEKVLKRISKMSKPVQTNELMIEKLIQRLEEKLEEFKSDFQSSKFSS